MLTELQLLALDRAVTADRVLSAAQVRRLCGALPAAAEQASLGLQTVSVVLETVSGSAASHRRVTLYARMTARQLRGIQEWRLGHLAGAAQARQELWRFSGRVRTALELAGCAWPEEELRALQFDPAGWRSEAHAVGESEQPDATWPSSSGLVAVEFDTGSYRPPVIAAKLRAFSAYPGGLIWIASAQQRVVTLRRRLPRSVLVLHGAWWE